MCVPIIDLAARTLAKGKCLGFEWEIVRATVPYGYCGYVRVEPRHPWFGKDYDDVDVDAPGGLTFGRHGKACPTHGELAEYWLGFDTLHCERGIYESDLTFEETRGACLALCRQAKDALQ